MYEDYRAIWTNCDIFKLNKQTSLNAFAALEAKTRTAVREQIIAAVVNDGNEKEKKKKKIPETSLYRLADVQMHLPVEIPEYTDFFCSLEHCRNVSRVPS
jgi:fumarylacetoacetase